MDKPQVIFWIFVSVIIAGSLRLFFILSTNFPLNDGGMFYSIILDIQAADFGIPYYLSYNLRDIPFAYPPSSFYLAALLSTFFPVLQILRWLPLIANTICIPLVYVFARQLHLTRKEALISTLIFGIIPNGYQWFIMGGGLTRSIGLLSGLTSVVIANKFFENNKKVWLIYAVLMLSLTFLTHPEVFLFTCLVILLRASFFEGSKREAFIRLLLVFIGAFLVTLPWVLFIVSRYGLEPFRAAFSTGGSVYWAQEVMSSVMLFQFLAGPFLGLVNVAALLGFWF